MVLPDSEIDAAAIEGVIPATEPSGRDVETIILKLEEDLDDLVSLGGRYTTGVPVLGLRVEDFPGFDKKKHCNRVYVGLVKPRTVRTGDGWIASYDGGRFSISFGEGDRVNAWSMDSDDAQRFFWIYPGVFGHARRTRAGSDRLTPWKIATAYNNAFQAEPRGSARRRWIAQAYLLLALRTYRHAKLVGPFPKTDLPDREDVWAAIESATGVRCSEQSKEVVCLASDLIERNETASPGRRPSKDVIRTGDALYMNSGISTGIRQLDFGTRNEQAAEVGPRLLPMLYETERGFGYLRAIRLWEVNWLNRWYESVGKEANERLSEPEAKDLLVKSHAQFIAKETKAVGAEVERAFPRWSDEERTLLTIIYIDLKNVTGHRLNLAEGSASYCDVLREQTAHGGRSNLKVAKLGKKRVANALALFRERFEDYAAAACFL